MVEEEVPYEWPATSNVPTEVLQLWTEVENGLDKSQTGTLSLVGFIYPKKDYFDRLCGGKGMWRETKIPVKNRTDAPRLPRSAAIFGVILPFLCAAGYGLLTFSYLFSLCYPPGSCFVFIL